MIIFAGLLGFSMLLGACTWRPTSRGSQRVLTGSRHETTALRLDRDRLAGEPADRWCPASGVTAGELVDDEIHQRSRSRQLLPASQI